MKKVIIVVVAFLYSLLFLVNYSSANDKNNLKEEIIKFKEENDVVGEDAYCDAVFKTIPGFSSTLVNIDESYEAMVSDKIFDEELIVYEEIKHNTIDELNCGPIYKGNDKLNISSLIINVAWGEEYIIDMLDILDEENISANFFIEGRWAKNNVDLVKEIHERGHLIGNHSYSHADFKKLSDEDAMKEIIDTNLILEEVTNYKLKYFGPPSGSFNDMTSTLVKKLKMETVLWSLDTIDWQRPSVEKIKSRIRPKLVNGSIILMHPTENTKDALSDIIQASKDKGIKLDTLEKLFYN